MSEEQKFKIAKEYVDGQFETMRTFNAAPSDISEDEYRTLIEDVAQLVEA